MDDHELEALLVRGHRYALSLTHDPSGADDLLQDAWARVLHARGPWAAPYLFRTIRNLWIDGYRRSNIVAMDLIESADAFPGPAGNPGLDRVALQQALAVLRPEEREALYLCAVEGYTAREVAEICDRPRNTVLSLVHRARQRMRSWLAADEREVMP